MEQTGRDSIFRDKRHRRQGYLTDDGQIAFEKARQSLTSLYTRVFRVEPKGVSDADVIEFCVRGFGNTVAYLTGRKQETARRQARK